MANVKDPMWILEGVVLGGLIRTRRIYNSKAKAEEQKFELNKRFKFVHYRGPFKGVVHG